MAVIPPSLLSERGHTCTARRRSRDDGSMGVGFMEVRLTRKLAESLDGVDLSDHRVGDVFDVTRHEAELLIAEEWAVQVAARPPRMKSGTAVRFRRGMVENQPRRRSATLNPNDMKQPSLDHQERRRAENRFREELRDSRAKLISKRTL